MFSTDSAIHGAFGYGLDGSNMYPTGNPDPEYEGQNLTQSAGKWNYAKESNPELLNFQDMLYGDMNGPMATLSNLSGFKLG